LLSYDECFELYPSLETREEREIFLYTMAHRQSTFINKKDNLATITEIVDYVRELPEAIQTQRILTMFLGQFRAQTVD